MKWGRLSFTGENEWRQFLPRYWHHWNWTTFHLFQWRVEYSWISSYLECACILLGLGFTLRWRWTSTHSPIQDSCAQVYEDILAGETFPGGFDNELEKEGSEERKDTRFS